MTMLHLAEKRAGRNVFRGGPTTPAEVRLSSKPVAAPSFNIRFSFYAAICLGTLTVFGGCESQPDREREQPAVIIGRETDNPAAHMTRLKAVIRQDARTAYGDECPSIEIPDGALIPVEITGGGLPEIAVNFGRVRCGGALTRFTGTGGAMVQFWIGSGGPVRLLLEHQMHGFTPDATRLITMQHGGFCPGGAGPDQCRVIYQWNDKDRRLDVIERTLASTLNRVDTMSYDVNAVCGSRERQC